MTLLSICIPVTDGGDRAVEAVGQMLQNGRSDFEILMGGAAALPEALSRFVGERADPRLRLVEITPGTPLQDGPALESDCWNHLAATAKGDWICFIGDADYADPDICAVLEATLKRVPQADALAWASASFVRPDARQGTEIAAIGTGSSLNLPEQKDMMQKLFYWADAADRPDCPFGAWHGAIRRSLLERIRESFSDVYFEQPDPRIDSMCKTVLMAQRMVFWERPLSVRDVSPMSASAGSHGSTHPPLEGFPFSAETGVAARTGFALEAFKRRYGIELDGWEENFIKACANDCEAAQIGEEFHARKAAYAKAITDWRGKRAATAFKPEFRRNPKVPRYRGLKDGRLYFDMEMDETKSAAAFYTLIDAMLFPVHLLDQKLA